MVPKNSPHMALESFIKGPKNKLIQMIKIIIDTNVLLAKNNVDIFSELERICDFNYDICIIDKTIDEIKNKKNANLAMALINSKKISIIKTDKKKSVDDLILEAASKDKSIIVVTQDIDLKRALKEKGINIITIRQKNHLMFAN